MSPLFPVVLIVFGVSQNRDDEHFLRSVIDACNESEIVSSNIENRPSSHLVCVRVQGPDFSDVSKRAFLDFLKPLEQWGFGLRVSLVKLNDASF